MNQPIHTTIKPAIKAERFELTWAMIEYLTSEHIRTNADNFYMIVQEAHTTVSNKILHRAATSLEIILQCQTFSPGVFEKNENGRWQRAGTNPKHDNTEGC